MELLKTAKSLFEELSSKECDTESIRFEGLYHLQRMPAEDFPLKKLLGKSAKESDFILVQRCRESRRSESKDGDGSDVYSDEETSTSVLNELGDSVHIDISMPGVTRKLSTTRPLSVQEVRRVLSMYATSSNPHIFKNQSDAISVKRLPVWIPCSAVEPECIGFMGTHIDTTSSGQAAGFTTYKVSCTGPVVVKSELPTLEQVLREHRYHTDCHHVFSKGYAQYDVFGSMSHDVSLSSGQLGQHSSLTIDCTWDNVTQILQKPPQSAKSTVYIKVVPGDTRSVIHAMYKELCTLVSFAKGLETGEIQWARSKAETDEDSLPNQVSSFIEDMKKGTQRKVCTKEEDSTDKDFDSPMHRQLVPERKSLDFTEQLWNLLQNAASYQEVVDSLNIVLRALQNGEIQPMVHRNNQTLIAKAVRLSYERKINQLRMHDTSPIELLVEIGMDKIRRDYTTYFVAEKLVMLEELDFYTRTELSTKEEMERLQRLYNVLELAVGSIAFLKLPLQNHRSLVRCALKHYESYPHDKVHTFELSLEAALIKGLYANLQPTVWRLELKGATEAATICQLSSTPAFDHIECADTQDMSRNDVEDSLYYFVTAVTQSQTKYS
ncbi:protein zwilch homolog [Ptychodera flava]|uniref:protein zwilch homolog n=1 Tax=Ptychodera flava TaxID=63121 RepID=UPI00396A33C6